VFLTDGRLGNRREGVIFLLKWIFLDWIFLHSYALKTIRRVVKLKCEDVSRSVMSNSVTPWTAAHEASLSMEFSRQEYCSE